MNGQCLELTTTPTTVCNVDFDSFGSAIAIATTNYQMAEQDFLDDEQQVYSLDSTTQQLFADNTVLPSCSNLLTQITSADVIHSQFIVCTQSILNLSQGPTLHAVILKLESAIANCNVTVSLLVILLRI